MKILYVSATGTLGGSERSLLDLVESVRQRQPNWKLQLLTLGQGNFREFAHDAGCAIQASPMPGAANLLGDSAVGGPAGHQISRVRLARELSLAAPQLALYIFKLRRFICSQAPDIVHSNGLKAHILATWTAPPQAAVIWHVRDYVSVRPVMSHLMRLRAHRCTHAIANSNSVATDLNEVCRRKLKITTVYNAIDLRRFNPEGPVLDVDGVCGLPAPNDDLFRVGLVATNARWKGHEVFLRAISMLPEQNVRAYVIGGPIYGTNGSQYTLEELRALARAQGVEQRVGFTGFIKDPAAALRRLDVVVHASTRPEPFGRVVAEAMACGKAVVVSQTGGVTEIIRDNENAVSCPPGDAMIMAARIAHLRADPDLRHQLGARARTWAEQRFDRARLAGEIVPIYESIS